MDIRTFQARRRCYWQKTREKEQRNVLCAGVSDGDWRRIGW